MSNLINQPVTFSISNFKGGVGKTETNLRLALALSSLGLRVTMIDMDPQGNLTGRAGGVVSDRENIGNVLGGAMASQIRLAAAIQRVKVEGQALDLVGANLNLENVAVGLGQKSFGRLTGLANAIQADRLALGDVVLIDTPPNAGILTLNALCASDFVIVVSDPEPDAITGIKRLREVVAMIAAERPTAPAIMGTIATRVNPRLKRHVDGLQALMGNGMPALLGTVPIRAGADATARLNEAYAPIAQAILNRITPA